MAGYSAYAKRANRALAVDQAISFADQIDEPQISNRAAKTSRLAVQVALADTAAQPSYVLASAQSDMNFAPSSNPLIAATPAIPESAPATSELLRLQLTETLQR